jgi:hypothetical protein
MNNECVFVARVSINDSLLVCHLGVAEDVGDGFFTIAINGRVDYTGGGTWIEGTGSSISIKHTTHQHDHDADDDVSSSSGSSGIIIHMDQGHVTVRSTRWGPTLWTSGRIWNKVCDWWILYAPKKDGICPDAHWIGKSIGPATQQQ